LRITKDWIAPNDLPDMKTKLLASFKKARNFYRWCQSVTDEAIVIRIFAIMIVLAGEHSRWQQRKRERNSLKRARRAAARLAQAEATKPHSV